MKQYLDGKRNGLEITMCILALIVLIISVVIMWNIKADTDKLVHEVLQQNSYFLHNVPK